MQSEIKEKAANEYIILSDDEEIDEEDIEHIPLVTIEKNYIPHESKVDNILDELSSHAAKLVRKNIQWGDVVVREYDVDFGCGVPGMSGKKYMIEH